MVGTAVALAGLVDSLLPVDFGERCKRYGEVTVLRKLEVRYKLEVGCKICGLKTILGSAYVELWR